MQFSYYESVGFTTSSNMSIKKIDLIISITISFLVAVYFIFLFFSYYDYIWILLVIFPVLGIIGMSLATIIGRKFLFVYQLAKFLLIGSMTALVDLTILNLLIFGFGISGGIWFSVFKVISFLLAFSTKYIGDKVWAFENNNFNLIKQEMVKFTLVTLVGLLINVVVASLVVNLVGPQFGLSAHLWANIAGIVASLSTIFWNFPAYKFIVFKK